MPPILNTAGVTVELPDVVAAHGTRLLTRDGREFLDFESGVWCMSVGHANPRVRLAMDAQLDQVAHVGYRWSHPIVTRAAMHLGRISGLPGAHTLLLSSGSEAVEFAIRLAGHLTGRRRFVRIGGHYLSALGLSGDPLDPRWITIDPSEPELPSFDDVAALVFEPGNASGLVALPEPGLVAELVTRVRAAGGLVVVDEVTTGCGRTGRWFGFQHYPALCGRAAPDIIAVGKGFGNGYPVSAVLTRGEVAIRLNHSPLAYAQSHQNDPLGAAVVDAVIREVEERDLLTAAAGRGLELRASLEELADRTHAIADVRGIGLMIAFTVTGGPGTVGGANDGGHRDAESVRRALFERGILVGVNQSAGCVRLYPPLTVTRGQAELFIEALTDVLTTPDRHPAGAPTYGDLLV